jgi:beta-phosphoglucomutase-like phosphatase (HAD superfamily)
MASTPPPDLLSRMVDAVLLEWDEVLTDTGAARREALLRALADEGVAWNVEAYDAHCTGLDVHHAAGVAVARTRGDDPALVDLVVLRAGRAFTERLARGVTLREGASEFLRATEPRARLAIATRASRSETDLFLRLSALDGMMACVFTADDVLQAPPSPELYDQAAAHLARTRRARREHTVALVSSTPAIRAARAAGVHVLAVGAPAHVALDADGAIPDLTTLTLDELAILVGITTSEHPT